MIRQTVHMAMLGSALVALAIPTPGAALSIPPVSCMESENVEYLSPLIDTAGYVTADQVIYRGGSLDGDIVSSADVFADCKYRTMIVVKNNGFQPFAETVHFDRAVKATEAYTFRDIARIMRDEGFDARVKKIRKGSCLCDDGFATEPRN